LDQLSGVQLLEWEAYDTLDPIGKWRDDFHMAYLASVVTNLMISIHCKEGTKLTKPIDFMPDWIGDRDEVGQPTQSVDEMKAILLTFANAQNRKVATDKKKDK
jgi:hypothetical protein